MGGVEEGDTLDELRVHAGQTIDRDDGSEGEEDGEEEDNGETEDEASARDNTSMVEAGASTPAFASRAGGKAGKGPVLETAKLDRITWDPGEVVMWSLSWRQRPVRSSTTPLFRLVAKQSTCAGCSQLATRGESHDATRRTPGGSNVPRPHTTCNKCQVHLCDKCHTDRDRWDHV